MVGRRSAKNVTITSTNTTTNTTTTATTTTNATVMMMASPVGPHVHRGSTRDAWDRAVP
jgi:hypothetical protein